MEFLYIVGRGKYWFQTTGFYYSASVVTSVPLCFRVVVYVDYIVWWLLLVMVWLVVVSLWLYKNVRVEGEVDCYV